MSVGQRILGRSLGWGEPKVLADSQVYTLYSRHAQYHGPSEGQRFPSLFSPLRWFVFSSPQYLRLPVLCGEVRQFDHHRSVSMAERSARRPCSRRFGQTGVSLEGHASTLLCGSRTDQVARQQCLDLGVDRHRSLPVRVRSCSAFTIRGNGVRTPDKTKDDYATGNRRAQA